MLRGWERLETQRQMHRGRTNCRPEAIKKVVLLIRFWRAWTIRKTGSFEAFLQIDVDLLFSFHSVNAWTVYVCLPHLFVG